MPAFTLDKVRVVMVGTTDAGNIGAAARAMKVMGLSRLHLVRPQGFPSAKATARAAGADDLLAAAGVHESLGAAVSDCALVYATTARKRSGRRRTLAPRELASEIVAGTGETALVFGPEHSGLANSDLDLCHALVRIPTVAGFSSLNVAAAVQIICYELAMAASSVDMGPGAEETTPASVEQLEGFYQHLEQCLRHTGFMQPGREELLMRRLRALFARAMPDADETRMLRGVLSSVLKLPRR